MNLAHIIEDLAYDMGGEFPRDAIEAAIAKRKQITPHLLMILEDAIYRIDEIIEDDNYQGHLYAMYLLAQFREEKAYPLIIELFSYPGEIPHAIAGDVLTEDLSRILASVCGKNIDPLKKMIENPSINEYVRAACQACLVTLVGCGFINRKEVIEYFRALFHEKLEKHPSFVWDHLIVSSCSLYPEEIFDEIKRAFDRNLINKAFISIEDVVTTLGEEKQRHLFQLFHDAELIDDTVAEMEKWMGNYSLQ
ncbi:MAG: DUF1186 domain-containing protein [Chlamydiales bacterium]